jgi:hypothetical protein
MAQPLSPAAPTPATVVAGELVDQGALGARAAEIAARQRAPETRRSYAAVYWAFGAFLEPDVSPADVIAEAVRAYRDALEGAGRSPATVDGGITSDDTLARCERGNPRAVGAEVLVVQIR